MNGADTNDLEHRIEKVQGLVWMALASVMAVLAHQFDPGAEPVVFLLVVSIATLAYAGFVLNTLKTNRYGLPLLRAFGKEEWSYYYTPPEVLD